VYDTGGEAVWALGAEDRKTADIDIIVRPEDIAVARQMLEQHQDFGRTRANSLYWKASRTGFHEVDIFSPNKIGVSGWPDICDQHRTVANVAAIEFLLERKIVAMKDVTRSVKKGKKDREDFVSFLKQRQINA
jgi:hypothetical protein